MRGGTALTWVPLPAPGCQAEEESRGPEVWGQQLWAHQALGSPGPSGQVCTNVCVQVYAQVCTCRCVHTGQAHSAERF